MNRAFTVPSAAIETMCSGLQVMPNSAVDLELGVCTTTCPVASWMCVVKVTGRGVVGHVEGSLTLQRVRLAGRVKVTVRTAWGCSSVWKKSAERRCLSRCLWPVSGELAPWTVMLAEDKPTDLRASAARTSGDSRHRPGAATHRAYADKASRCDQGWSRLSSSLETERDLGRSGSGEARTQLSIKLVWRKSAKYVPCIFNG